MNVPDGYREIRSAGARAFAVAAAVAWVETALREAGSLYGRAASTGDRVVLEGRAPVYVVPGPEGRVAVRRYHRGGAMAPLLGDRHLRLGEPRPLREAWASEAARRRGVPTPRVLAGAVHPRGAFYRADLVTEYVSGSSDLAGVLFGDAPGPEPERALRMAGRLVATLARARLRHPDLNAKNVLLAGTGPVLLDLDRCRVLDEGEPISTDTMAARLTRSLRKFEARTGRRITDREWDALEAGLHEPLAPGNPP